MPMKRTLAHILKSFGFLKFDLLARSVTSHPTADEAEGGDLLLVRDGEIEKWACFGCPGGCGKMIALSLNPTRRPRWKVTFDFWKRPTVKPSVHQLNECGCHFWITSGRIRWCERGRPN